MRRSRQVVSLVMLLLVVCLSLPSTLTAATTAQRFGSKNLQRGARGTVVSELQRALTRLGYSTGVISGYFGPVTERQVKAYQRARKLPQTGVVGVKTKAALTADLNRLEQPIARAERNKPNAAAEPPSPPPVKGKVILTFNDSPNEASTLETLKALKAAGVSATFFCTGERAEASPALVQEIIAGGHGVGVHGWSEDDYSLLTEAEIVSDLRSALVALTDAGAPAPTWFRPPHGAFDKAVMAAAQRFGLLPCYWSNIGGAADIDKALKSAFDGATLSLPDTSVTAKALPKFLVDLRAAGWEVKSADAR